MSRVRGPLASARRAFSSRVLWFLQRSGVRLTRLTPTALARGLHASV